MTKKVVIIVILFCLIGVSVQADQFDLDYPHNATNTINCWSCHYYSNNPAEWAKHTPQDIDDTPWNKLCWDCHNDTDADYVKTHSSLAATDTYGTWTLECKTCHWAHHQSQLRTYGAESYLYTATTDQASATALTRSGGAAWTANEYEGYLVIPNISQRSYNYKILSNTEDTLTVEGPIDTAKLTEGNSTLAIIYGKLIRSTIATPYRVVGQNSYLYTAITAAADGNVLTRSGGAAWQVNEYKNYIVLPNINEPNYEYLIVGNTEDSLTVRGDIDLSKVTPTADTMAIYRAVSSKKTVKLFDSTGAHSFADGDSTYDGVCEVCHTQPSHFRNDGSGSQQIHENISGGKEGTDCMTCHNHLSFAHGIGGVGCGTANTCHGLQDSHPTHVDADTGKGLSLACNQCHDTDSFPDFTDATTLAATTVCNTCHSPNGTYDGVNDAVIGAKNFWTDGVYNGGNLLAGKEKWCASCHDESPSVISGVSAPNIVGDEDDSSYIYGGISTGWGYYKTGHGLPAGSTYPASGGVTAGAGVGCDGCHDFTADHNIDGNVRTFADGDSSTLDPSNYRQGYRLKLVTAGQGTGASTEEPLLVPWPSATSNSANNYRLCANCHASGPFTNSADTNTNLKTDGVNRHETHLVMTLRYQADWSGGNNSKITCMSCHNVHGSTYLAMVRDGKLLDQEAGQSRSDGLQIWYKNDGITTFSSSNPDPPTPENLSLAASDGTIWIGSSSSKLCSHCHFNGNTVDWDRTPYQNVDQAPILSWTGDTGYVADGVNPDSGESGSDFVFKVEYSDANNDTPNSIQVWVDIDDNSTFAEGEKYTMTAVDGGDTNYMDGNDYTKTLALNQAGDNSFNYRFYATDGTTATGDPTSNYTVSITNPAPILSWTGETYYTSDGVNPDTGGNGSSFTFRIKYTDSDNESPASIQVWIDIDDNTSFAEAEKYTMTADGGGASYTEGKYYTYSKTLNYAGDGDLKYKFYTTDGTSAATSEGGPVNDNIVTVSSSSNSPPTLDWASGDCLASNGVRPQTGATGADFQFLVVYTDADNECPPAASDMQVWIDADDSDTYESGEKHDMVELDGGDSTCSDGKTYSYTTALAYDGDGSFIYRFYASDGTDDSSGDPTDTNSTVTVVNTSLRVRPSGGPYNTIQSAIDVSTDPSTILVYPNADFSPYTYTESVLIGSKHNRTVQAVCGADSTIVDGGSYSFKSEQSNNTVIDGFMLYGSVDGLNTNMGTPVTIQNCTITNNSSRGINIVNSTTDLTVDNCLIYGNGGTAGVNGAGIYLNGGPHSISNTIIRNNTAVDNLGSGGLGGGVYLNATPIGTAFTNTTIKDNTAAGAGGGLYFSGSKAEFNKCIITGNTSASTGGAMGTNNSTCTPSFTNCLIADNQGTSSGVINLNGGTATFINSTLANNQATAGGGGISNICSGTITMRNSIAWGNTASTSQGHNVYRACTGSPQNVGIITYSDFNTTNITYMYNATVTDDRGGSTNIDPASDPVFEGSGDYHLQSNSPVIDQAGAADAPDTDIDDDTRPVGAADDMGYDEYQTPNNAPTLDWTGEANYTSDGVNPNSGAGGASFELRIKYTDADDTAPTSIQVWVDEDDSGIYDSDEKYDMDAVDGDSDYTDGKLYTKTLSVLYAGDGSIRYRFYARDNAADATGSPTVHNMVTISNNAPVLAWTNEANYTTDGAHPDSGVNGNDFIFRVKYTDTDNTAPTSIQVWFDENDDTSYSESEKYTMTADGGGASYTEGVFYTKTLPLYRDGDGTQNYRFHASDGTDDATGTPTSNKTITLTNNAPTLAWLGSGNYVSDGVDPNSGPNGSSFTFKANYTDADDTAPTVIQLWLDEDDNSAYAEGEKYTMTVEGGDGDYSNGEIFTKTLTINHPGGGSDGIFDYRFYGYDGAATATGEPASSYTVALASSNNPPVLAWTTATCLTDGVRPYTGATGADFEFWVEYTDDDDDAPTSIEVWVDVNDDGTIADPGEHFTMTEVDSGDTTYSDGKLYTHTVAVSYGSDGVVDYRFYATDGADDATGTPVSVTTHDVVNTSYKVRPGGGGGWYSTISSALTSSNTVLVYPNSDFTPYTYNESVAMYNRDNLTIQSVCGADSTIIDGSGTIITLQDSSNFVLDGFSITGGGNGVYVNRVDSTVNTVKNSKIFGNSVGFYINDSDSIPILIDNCEIYNNSTRAISLITSDDHFDLENSVIHSHNVSSTGAAVSFNNGGVGTITNSVIRDNTSSVDGGVFYVNGGGANLTVTNSIITGNQGANGGVFRTNSGPTISIKNSTFADNQATNGGVFYICTTGSNTIRNSIFWNNTATSGATVYKACGSGNIGTVSSTNISSTEFFNSTFTDDGGNITPAQDPQFIGSGDYHLCNGSGDPDPACGATQSPCIDAADSAYAPNDDIDGDSRPYNGTDDMGADEYVP